MTEVIGLALELVFLFIIFVIGPLLIYIRNRKRIATHEMTVKGKRYTYIIGNSIEYQKHGVAIQLHSPLPALYLDTLGMGENKYATISTLMNAEKFALEGDFSDMFQVFCVKGNEQNVLRVLTPEIMAILADYAHKFDVEIDDKKLWILCDKKITKNTALQKELMQCAFMLLNELDRVFAMNTFDFSAVVNFDKYYVKTVKVFGRYIQKDSIYLTLFCLFFASVIWASLLYAYTKTGVILYIALLLSLIIFPLIPYAMAKEYFKPYREPSIISKK